MLTNYRPISLLVMLYKVLEKIMSNRIYKHMEKTNWFYKCQNGFRETHNCEQTIMNLVGKIVHGMNKEQLTIALFLDLSKAFDTLNHNILVKKFDRYGISGVAKYWLINFYQIGK